MNHNYRNQIIIIYSTFFTMLFAYLLIRPLYANFDDFLNWNNWRETFIALKIGDAFYINVFNSIKVTLIGTIVGTTIATLTAYSLAVYDFKIKKLVMILLVLTLMIPPIIQIVPFIVSINVAKEYLSFISSVPILSLLADQHLALVLPYLVPAFGIFIIKQYLESVLNFEMIEAARVEGASEARIFYRLIVPIISPAISIVVLIQFVAIWNNYDFSEYLIGESESKVLAHSVRTLITDEFARLRFEAPIMNNFMVIIPIVLLLLLSNLILRFINADLTADE